MAAYPAGTVAGAVLAGGVAVLVATPPHTEAITAAMDRAGADVPAARRDGRLLAMDAESLLSRFVTAGRVDRGSFMASVGCTPPSSGPQILFWDRRAPSGGGRRSARSSSAPGTRPGRPGISSSTCSGSGTWTAGTARPGRPPGPAWSLTPRWW